MANRPAVDPMRTQTRTSTPALTGPARPQPSSGTSLNRPSQPLAAPPAPKPPTRPGGGGGGGGGYGGVRAPQRPTPPGPPSVNRPSSMTVSRPPSSTTAAKSSPAQRTAAPAAAQPAQVESTLTAAPTQQTAELQRPASQQATDMSKPAQLQAGAPQRPVQQQAAAELQKPTQPTVIPAKTNPFDALVKPAASAVPAKTNPFDAIKKPAPAMPAAAAAAAVLQPSQPLAQPSAPRLAASAPPARRSSATAPSTSASTSTTIQRPGGSSAAASTSVLVSSSSSATAPNNLGTLSSPKLLRPTQLPAHDRSQGSALDSKSSISLPLIAPVKPVPPAAAAVPAPSAMTLVRPDAPTLRVLESLMPAAPSGRRVRVEEVVEDPDSLAVDVDDEFLNTAVKKGKKGGKRKEKVTAAMKREARKQREAERDEKAAASRRDREEIFEIGEEGMTLDDIADYLQIEASDIVRTLFMKGLSLSMTQTLDRNTVKLVAAEYGVLAVDKEEAAVTLAKKRTDYLTDDDIEFLTPRPPVVTVMGHVDHGKTSLLDYIRKARVAAGEAGGITQAIGAYNTQVEVDGDEKTICFLDTPGHEAFSAMRARGAQVTDIAIIIVAADDGVRPQTREAVAHAQAAEVPIVVAINKIDKPGADPERVKRELTELNLVPEEWGGSTPMVSVSAKKGSGVSDLLTQVLWVAEEKQLMSNPTKAARGMVIEANLNKQKGAVATLLVQAGTLRVGDYLRAGSSLGRVRAMYNDMGQVMKEAGPSIAVQLYGLNSVPAAGEEFEVHPNEQSARAAAAEFQAKYDTARLAEMSGGGSMVTLSSLATVDDDQEAMQKINLIVKADTMGMVEAIKSALGMLPQLSVTLRFLLASTGDISSSDVDLAAASGAWILAFNMEPDDSVTTHAKRNNVNIKSYKIIYELIDDVKAAMEGKLKLVEERVPLGMAVVKAIFGTGKKRIAGCAVNEGKLMKNTQVSVRRGRKEIVYEGKLSSLRRIKDSVEEVPAGLECGVGCDGFLEWAEGDVIECYQLVTKSRKLEDAKATMAVDLSAIEL